MWRQHRTITWAAILFFGLVGWAAQSHAQSCDAPKPNLQIAKPGAGISPNAGAFSGEWDGTWTFQAGSHRERHTATLCSKLFVLVTSNTSANVGYCTGSSERGVQPTCTNYTATIDGNKLTFGTNSGATLIFTASGGTTLSVEDRAGSGRTVETQFHRAG